MGRWARLPRCRSYLGPPERRPSLTDAPGVFAELAEQGVGAGKQPNQLRVRFGQRQSVQFGARDPPHVLAKLRLGLTRQHGVEEVELDRPFGICVTRHQHAFADDDTGGELLVNLANQAGFRRLVGLALPAGELPRPRQVRAFEAAGEEERAVAFDDGGGDEDGGVLVLRAVLRAWVRVSSGPGVLVPC